ncbi:MAG: diacylglycerol kinase family lipid kinase [Sphingobacteriales bacterium]|nr:MAG: diacylglycerol kinase family lipid kinase [Sphingobacteriales bacterium]
MTKKKALIVINPKSGTTTKADIEQLAMEFLDKGKFDIEFYYTQFAGDARNAAQNAEKENVDIVIAVGGDGTINEIGSQLLHSKVTMAVIPLGSGNGLARHLKIPLDIPKAFSTVNNLNIGKIDSATINQKPFFNVSGIGFDAFVSYIFATLPKRGFGAYVKATWRAFFNFKPFHVEIQSGNKKHFSGKCYMVSVANSSQFGNNCYINPQADVKDGVIEIGVIIPFPRILVPVLVFKLFRGNIHLSRFIKTFSVKQATITSEIPVKMHLDGEVFPAETNFEVGVIPASLRVVTPL